MSFIDVERPSLVEPGMKYFLRETLKQCKDFKNKYNNLIFNIAIGSALFLVVGIVFGIYYASKQKPQYEAEVVFSLESGDQGSMGSYASLASQFGIAIGGGGGGAFMGDNLIELLQSKKMIEKTLLSSINLNGKKKLLIDYLIEFNEMNKSWSKDTILKNIVFSNPQQQLRAKDSILNSIVQGIIQSTVKVEKIDKNLDYISLKVTSSDETFSKNFAETLINNTTEFYKEYKSMKAAQNLAMFQNQLDSVKHSMYNSLEDIAVVNDLNINPIKNVTRVSTQKKQVRLKTEGELIAELEKNVELAKIALIKETPLIQIIDTPKMPLPKKKMGKLMGGLLFGFLLSFLAIVWTIFSTILIAEKIKISSNKLDSKGA